MIRLVKKDGEYFLQERLVIGHKMTGSWWSPESEPIWGEWRTCETVNLDEKQDETRTDI